MFDDMVVSGQTRKTHKRWTLVVSGIVQTVLLGILILIPLISYSELPKGFNATYLAAPPPPPAPAPPPPKGFKRPRTLIRPRILAPTVVPPHIAVINQPEPTFYPSNGGIPGGGGETGQLVDLLGSSATAPPPPPKPAIRLRIGGVVEAARLIHQTIPAYPGIARAAHVQGTIVLHAVIGKDGAITSLQYVSGPALLVKAAQDAVSTWRYQPLVLNGEPTEVETEISVVFTLSE